MNCEWMQSMPGNTCDYTCLCPHMCRSYSMSDKWSVPTSLLSTQLHFSNANFLYIAFCWPSMKTLPQNFYALSFDASSVRFARIFNSRYVGYTFFLQDCSF